jgi:hypothetical protein
MIYAHPMEFTASLLGAHTSICGVQISVYRYHSQSLLDDRTTYNISVSNLHSRYEALVSRIDDDQDIAFDSVVTMANGKTKKHFGLVDFNTSLRERAEEASDLLVREYNAPQAALVFSGRSYHLYLDVLLSHAAWVHFMGRILLLNLRNQPPVIDSRWVGHRLIGGCASLRWSAKGKSQSPQIIRQWSVDGQRLPFSTASVSKNVQP